MEQKIKVLFSQKEQGIYAKIDTRLLHVFSNTEESQFDRYIHEIASSLISIHYPTILTESTKTTIEEIELPNVWTTYGAKKTQAVKYKIPFTGDEYLLSLYNNQVSTVQEQIELNGSNIVQILYDTESTTIEDKHTEQFRKMVKVKIESVKEYLEKTKPIFEQLKNESLERIKNYVSSKVEAIKKLQTLEDKLNPFK